MVDSYESKLDVVLKAIEALTTKIGALEDLAWRVGTSLGAKFLNQRNM